MPEEVRAFTAEVKQLLNLMIHSLYSNRDIFLRELVANSADAIDKARFLSLTVPEAAADWEIRVEPDKKRGVLKISDNGVGMTRDELVSDIGTIAKSGTAAFLKGLKDKGGEGAPELIGQFGVGFYSVFMVADKVTLCTKKAASPEPAARWESSGEGEYTLSEDQKKEQGTEISIHLKPECKEYLEEWKIREIIKKYSDFIEHPIKVPVPKDGKDGSKGTELSTVNSQKALWLRKPNEVTDDEYASFYGHLAHFDTEPLAHIHFSAEGTTEFKALIFIPSKAPFDLFYPEQRRKGVQLYIRRVFITDDCTVLLPNYLRFVKGVVESNDLPLNISREMLQQNPKIEKIQKNLVRKILAELKSVMEKKPEKYASFHKEFGRVLKEGMLVDDWSADGKKHDEKSRDAIQDLLLFESLNGGEGKLISFKEYCEKMPSGQADIYCASGESRGILEKSPHTEAVRAKGYDVLLMTDPIDEWVFSRIHEYKGKKIRFTGKGDLGLERTDEEKKAEEKAVKEGAPLLEALKEKLKDDIKDVRFSNRLTESLCCLVTEEHGMSVQMENLMKAMNKELPAMKRILEINPAHPLVAALNSLRARKPDSPLLADAAELIYGEALLAEGLQLKNPAKFARAVAELMTFKAESEAGK